MRKTFTKVFQAVTLTGRAAILAAAVGASAPLGAIDLSVLDNLQYSTSAASAGRRLELREEGTVGHALVNGTEYKGDPNGGAATAWDTASLTIGWQTLTSGTNAAAILKLDSATTAIEGGRLQSNTTWSNAKTHVVRNWVTVPSGVTLTISQGTIVKFCESAGIKVLSGGKVQINGAEGADVFFAAIGNDTYGGDTNLRVGDFETNSYEIVTLNGGTWSDNGYWVTPDARLRGYPEVTLHDSLASVSDGVARVPVTVEGTRNAPFSIDWQITGSPFSTTSGTLSWTQSSEGTKYIEIPLKSSYSPSGVEAFTVRATLARSVTRVNETAQVKVFKGGLDVASLQYSTSAASDGRRLELRAEGTVGHALVSGTEYKGDPNGGAATAWNIASLATGWQTLTSGTNSAAILKLDPATTAIEGGRLQSNTTWDSAKIHVMRNWVTVPSGVTLTITDGTIVKFCESAGIKVLSGGKVQINGAEGADVFFASIGNDTYGGDTNLRAGDFETNSYEIVTLNGGTWSDNGYWVTPDAAVRPYPEVALHDAIGAVEGGVVRVPVSVEGTRNAPFSIDWQITGAPFSTTSGTLTWSQSSEGTKFIEIPIKANYSPNGTESFALSATRARSVNLSNETVRVSVYSGHIAVGDVIENGESTPSAGTEIETRGIGGTMIAKALERITYSPRWSNAASCTVDLGGSQFTATAEGSTTWSRPSTPGLYTFTHKADSETLTARFAVLGDDVAVHAGTLETSETWGADKTHLVIGTVTVKSGVTLTIEPGAVVKFMPGAKLIVEAGGTCIAKGVKFTHAYDDAVGGDTLYDGAATLPVMEDYEIKGVVTDDGETEYRYTAPVVLSGTITANTTWRGWKVYNVTGNLTIKSGVTLTVEPGAVVKFNSGVSLTVSSGATLNAIGTRAQPIVFTSIKDDEYGGDTNGDGEKTYPWAGDWARIYAGGTLNMNYCRIRYCNNNSDNGAIQGSGGTVTFDNGIIESSVYECVRMNSGRFVSHNSVFRDASMGFGYYGGSGVYVYNGVVADCTTACRASNKHFYNTVFYNCLTFLESTSSSCDHCVFFNEPGMGAQSATQVGSNGNVWGDPKFVDAENGDFRIQKGSPCINAGDAVNAPEFDYYGQPRDDGAPDIGIYELAGGMSANDLAAVGGPRSVAAATTIGDTLTVAYEIANVGKQAINGSWRDKVSLVSADGGYSIDLGTVVQSAALAVGATNTFNASFTVPTDAEGTWRVQVGVNVERDIYEGANVTNNVATSEGTVEVSLPARTASDGFSGTATKGAPSSAKFALDGAEPMVARINAPAGTVVYLGSGFMPSASSYSARAVVGADGGLIGIPAGVTTAYLMVETASSQGAAFTMTLESAALAVQSVTPATLPYTGTTGLVIDGANFAEGCTVELGGPASVPAMATTVVSPTRLTAQIDCSRLTAGAVYDVKVVGPATGGSPSSVTATLPNAVTVANVPAAPKLKATLDAPASVRRGRTLTVYIDYENVGNADLPAPIFELISEGQVFKIDGACYTNSVKVMGLSAEAPVGTLRPGEPQRLGVTVTILAQNVKWKLRSYHAAQEGAKKKLQLEALMGERWVRDLAKSNTNLYFAVCSQFGRTWAECYMRIGKCLSDQLSEDNGILTFSEAIEIFAKEAYENAKSSLSSVAGQQSASLLSASPKVRLMGDRGVSEGELTGTKYNNDNSHDGDVWWYRGAKWLSVTNESVKTALVSHLGNVFLICHGNANSVHEPWIASLASSAVSAGYSAVFAVDWGDGSCSHLAVNPEKNSPYIPAAGAEAIRQLQKVGVSGGNLTVCGHSHGGHLGGIIAKGMGARRLIGMDTSPIWTHENTPAANRYPLGWSRASANTIEFYKTSWHYSMGTDPTDDGNGDIFGIPSFYVTQTGDFYNDDYVRGGRKRGDKWLKNLKALSRHGFSYEWVDSQMSLISTMDWKDSSKTWRQLSGSTGRLPNAGLFAGTLRDGIMECGAQVRKSVADELGVDMYSIGWNYDEYMFDRGQRPGTLMILQKKLVQISEHGLNGLYYTSEDFKTGQTYDWLLDGVQNYADNTSIDYNHSTIKDVDKPWDKGFGIAVFIADVSDFSSTLYGSITEGNTSSSGGRLKWADIEVLKNAGVRFELISSKCDESAFVRPGEKANDTGIVRMNGAIPESVFTGSDGLGDEEEGRLCLVVGAVGIVGTHGDAQLKLYDGELCPDNNFFARLIRVKSDGPTSDVLSGTALHYEWSYTQASAFAPENIQDDNTWTADENGNWVVTLTGATSYGPTNIVAGSWTGFDCTVSQREWSPNPNVTVTGHLFTGEDGDFVPAQKYTVILAVEDANGKIGTKEYAFTIKRHVDDDPGEDEDEDGSTEPMSCDPNEMVGPEGIGEQRMVQPGDWLTYTIYFENKSDAEAAAACVEMSNPLNEWLDWSSLTMLDVGYNNNVDNGLSGQHEGVSEKAMDGTNVSVRTEFAVTYYDEEGNVLDENALAMRSTMEGVYARAEWYLRIIDPNGDAEGWPLNMTGGFLPPNDEETHCGEGYIRYKIRVRDDAPGNVVITNSATIVFDHYNDPITTDPAWWNTVAQVASVKVNGEVEGDVAGLDLIVGMPYGELPTPKARAGYTFGGWYTGPNGTGRRVTAQSLVQAGDSALYAHWLQHAYTVHYEPNGGEGTMSDQAFEFDKEDELDANAFTRKFYLFTGWATNETGEAVFGDSAVVTNLTDMDHGMVTLYATWRYNAVEVSFDAQGGTPVPANSLYELDAPYGELPELTRSGFTFGGWYTGPNGTGRRVTVQDHAQADVTKLYAHWLAHAYTVRFHANGGTGLMSDQAFEFDKKAALDANAFTRQGFAFAGWATNATGVAVYADGVEVRNLTDVDGGVVTLYATWTINSYTVTFDANGGVGGWSSNMVYGAAITAPTVTREGYTFAGWQPALLGTVPANDVTFTAQWEISEIVKPDPGPEPDPEPVAEETPRLWTEVTGAAPSAAATYDGYLYDASGNVKGTIQVKVGKPNKKTGLAAVKATVIGTDGKKKTLKAAEKGKAQIAGDGPTTIPLAGGDACEVILGAKGMGGTYGAYVIDGSLNVFASKDAADKSVAAGVLGKWKGAVNVAWRRVEDNAPYQTLSVLIAAKGKAKVAGTLADGTKVSAKGQLVVGEEWCCVPVVVAKKAKLAFVVWLPLNEKAAGTAAPHGVAAPAVVGLGGDVKVGKPGALKAGAAFRLGGEMGDATYGAYLPNGVAVTGGAKWTLPKAGKVQLAKDGTVDAAKLGENPSGLKLTYKAKDGTFKGSFKAYADVGGKPKGTTVKVTGVLVGGTGYGAATVKGGGGVAVTVE